MIFVNSWYEIDFLGLTDSGLLEMNQPPPSYNQLERMGVIQKIEVFWWILISLFKKLKFLLQFGISAL